MESRALGKAAPATNDFKTIVGVPQYLRRVAIVPIRNILASIFGFRCVHLGDISVAVWRTVLPPKSRDRQSSSGSAPDHAGSRRPRQSLARRHGASPTADPDVVDCLHDTGGLDGLRRAPRPGEAMYAPQPCDARHPEDRQCKRGGDVDMGGVPTGRLYRDQFLPLLGRNCGAADGCDTCGSVSCEQAYRHHQSIRAFLLVEVSLDRSSVCVVNAAGKIVKETKVASDPQVLATLFKGFGFSGDADRARRWTPVALAVRPSHASRNLLLATRHVTATLSAMVVKTDRKEARVGLRSSYAYAAQA